MKRGRHHILQELPVKFHQSPPTPPQKIKKKTVPNQALTPFAKQKKNKKLHACVHAVFIFSLSNSKNEFSRKPPFCLLNFKE